jgi:hypothetical protein
MSTLIQNNLIENILFLSDKELLDKNTIENLDKNDIHKITCNFINKTFDGLSKLNEKELDIFSQNVNIIYSQENKYAIEEDKEREIIYNNNVDYNKKLYKPIDDTRILISNINNKIYYIKKELEDEKEQNSFGKVIGNKVNNISNSSSKLKDLYKEYNILNKKMKDLEEKYRWESKNTCIPFGDFSIGVCNLKKVLKTINRYKKKCQTK